MREVSGAILGSYSATTKAVNAENMSRMFIVLKPIRFKNKQTKS